MNKETHTSDHREHGQRQAVQHQVKTDVKVAYRHPRPQRLAVCLLAVSEEINADKGGYQRRQATEPTPTIAETFSDQRPRENASRTKPINGKIMVKAACSSAHLTY